MNRIIRFEPVATIPKKGDDEPIDQEITLDSDSEKASDEESLETDDDDDDDDGSDDDDDDDEDEDDEEDPYLRIKMQMAMEKAASMTCGRAIFHRDPADPNKLFITARVDTILDEYDGVTDDGSQMWDVTLMLNLIGGYAGPKQRLMKNPSLAKIFDQKNWSKQLDD